MEDTPPMNDPHAPDEDGNSNIVALAGAVGGGILVVGMLVIFFVLAPEPAPETASAAPASSGKKSSNRWPTAEELGNNGKTYTPKKKKKKRDVKRIGTPFGDSSKSFIIAPPSFGNCKTEADWLNRESEFSSLGTARGTWQLAYYYANKRNPRHDYGEAVNHLHDAYSAGAGVAAYDLGRHYEKGTWGVDVDKYEAKRYYEIALGHGISNANGALDRLEKEGY